MKKLIHLITIISTLFVTCAVQAQLISSNQHIYQQKPIWNENVVAPNVDPFTARELQEFFIDKNTVWYKLQRVYQHNGQLLSIEERPEFNANKDFPWISTAGLDEKAGPYVVVNAMRLPRGKAIAVLHKEFPVKWIFPPGTQVVEIILISDPTLHKQYVFEVRMREKSVDNDLWNVKVFRRFRNEAHLKAVINRLDRSILGTWDQNTTNKFFFFRNTEDTEVMSLSGKVCKIPNMSDNVVRQLFKYSLIDVSSEEWNDESDAQSATSDKAFNIFPKNYSFGVVPVDAESCARCHNQTGISVDKLIPNEPIIKLNPHLVGRIRGYDGIFSWYPFTQTSVSKHDGEHKALLYRKIDIDSNIVEIYDPVLHQDYKLTSYVENALDKNIVPFAKEVLHGLQGKDKTFPHKYPLEIK